MMKLFYSQTSPYARKVLMCAKELELEEQVCFEELHPIKNAEQLQAVNPLGKVPALRTAEGRLLIDSPVICRYLDDLACKEHGQKSLVWLTKSIDYNEVARLESFADGIMDIAYLYVMESLRPTEQQSPMWQQRRRDGMNKTVAFLEVVELKAFTADEHHLGQIALACALGYLDFRLVELNWRRDNSGLADWFERYSPRKAFIDTIPKTSFSNKHFMGDIAQAWLRFGLLSRRSQ